VKRLLFDTVGHDKGVSVDQRHQEYVDYYRARLAKFENNPLYPNCAAAERAMFDAISTASNLEEFGEREAAQKLSLNCAIARVRDTETAEANFYLELQETVRAKPHLEVLERLDQSTPQTVEDLSGMVSEIHVTWQLKISADETLRDEFWGDWKILEDIDCDEQAEVPPRWSEERKAAVSRELKRGAEHYAEHTLPGTRKFIPDYQPNWEELWQIRHRRRFPLADDIVKERIAAHRRYLGVS